jgi:serine/threonine protein kinase
MSPVADCNLKEYLQHAEDSTEPFYALRIREWFGCLATAIQYLHTNQIRHRDIKPANILVHGVNILLVDLELALDWKDLDQSTTTTHCGNTPLYAAPEVIERRRCNSTTDIWSLGCVFLEMVTVIKGKSISALRQYFDSQTNSSLFYHNPEGISGWISLLADVSAEDNEPLSWISNMLQPVRTIRARATTIVDQIRASHTSTSQPNPYFGRCCQQDFGSVDLDIPLCLLCGMKVLKV